MFSVVHRNVFSPKMAENRRNRRRIRDENIFKSFKRYTSLDVHHSFLILIVFVEITMIYTSVRHNRFSNTLDSTYEAPFK